MDLLLAVNLKVMLMEVKGWGWLSVEQFGMPAWGTSSFRQLGMSSEKLVISLLQEFPLTSLSLMDYCHITDTGIAWVAGMNTLTELSLSRTKLTDYGMPFLHG